MGHIGHDMWAKATVPWAKHAHSNGLFSQIELHTIEYMLRIAITMFSIEMAD